VHLLAAGGCGVVYLAYQVSLRRRVVVKTLHRIHTHDPEMFERFVAEARISANLNHPHIVRVLDHEVESGIPWIAFEYISGPSVQALLVSGPLDVDEALNAAEQVAMALEHAHAHQVFHRDVKPANVLQVRPELYKLADFGIAKWKRIGGLESSEGMVVGTGPYIAPELIHGSPPSARTDMYALGVTLYEMLTGRLPYEGATLYELACQQLTTAPEPPSRYRPEITPVIDRLVLDLLATDPDERIGSARAVRREIEQLRTRNRASVRAPLEPSRLYQSRASRRRSRPQMVALQRKPQSSHTWIAFMVLLLCMSGYLADTLHVRLPGCAAVAQRR
jgi:serine/threonine protein kinase